MWTAANYPAEVSWAFTYICFWKNICEASAIYVIFSPQSTQFYPFFDCDSFTSNLSLRVSDGIAVGYLPSKQAEQ